MSVHKTCMTTNELPPLQEGSAEIPQLLFSTNVFDNIYLVNLWGRTNATFVDNSVRFTLLLSDSVRDNLNQLHKLNSEHSVIRLRHITFNLYVCIVFNICMTGCTMYI